MKSDDTVAHLSQVSSSLQDQLTTSREICNALRKDLEIYKEGEKMHSADITTKEELLAALRTEKDVLNARVAELQDRVLNLASQCERLEVRCWKMHKSPSFARWCKSLHTVLPAPILDLQSAVTL